MVFQYKNKPEKIVNKIITAVKSHGDRALIYYTKLIDGVELDVKHIQVKPREIQTAYRSVNYRFIKVIRKTYHSIYKYHRCQLRQSPAKVLLINDNGRKIWQKTVPIGKVGIYVPGGKFSYPSTLLMCAIPARVAGVSELVVTTPPGKLSPELLVTADICKINKIYRLGGAMAIAALTYGTETIPQVNKIVGPGNVYVTLAKRMVYGDVGIDMLAGPSEIAIFIDDINVPIPYLVQDILAQTEHDFNARAVVISTKPEIIRQIKKQIPNANISQVTFQPVKNINQGIGRINDLAPEHLELIVRNSGLVLPHLKNVGTVFVGPYTPVAIGDYYAGPSHVLPTGGTAKFTAGLGINDFLKRIAVIKYTKQGLTQAAPYAMDLAEKEGLTQHRRSLSIRLPLRK